MNLCSSLVLKEEAGEYMQLPTLDDIIRKYSQFINFNIYLWKSTTTKEKIYDEEGKSHSPWSHPRFSVRVPVPAEAKVLNDTEKKVDADAAVEDAPEEVKKPKYRIEDKTTWAWELMNESKPIWQRK